MQLFYSSSLLLFLFATGGIAFAQDSIDRESNRYPEEFVRQYSTECMQTSMEEGLEESEAKSLCDCTLDRFQSRYELEEFQQLTINSASDTDAQATLIEVGQICFEEILYEQ